MSKPVCLLTLLWLIYAKGVNGTCSYYQTTEGLIFPEGQCINSTLNKANDKRSSSGYFCGLFGVNIYKREYSSDDCSGSYTLINLGSCSSPQCHCSTLQCPATTVTYDRRNCENHDKYENITIVTDQCINKMKFYIQSNDLYAASYDNTNCDGDPTDTMHLSCYTVDKHAINGDTETDTDTDTILTLRPSSTAIPSEQQSRLQLGEYKGLIIVSIVGIMVIGTLCSICCMMRKHRKKQRNPIADIRANDERAKKLIENDIELNHEGIRNEPHDEIEEIEIPGKAANGHDNFVDINHGELDQNVVDKIVNEYINYNDDDERDDDEDNQNEQDDIPIAAFSDYNYENEYDQEIEISEGNEGMMDDEEEDDGNGEEESGGQDIDNDDE